MTDSRAPRAVEDLYRSYGRHLAGRGRTEPDLAAARSDPKRFATPERWWPRELDAKILDVGCGWGGDLLNLWAGGYRNLTGIDISEGNVEVAQRCTPGEVTVVRADAMEYLAGHEGEYDLVLCLDVLEHFEVAEGLRLATLMHGAVRPGGRCVVRTPNMGSLLGSFSRHLDLTHRAGFTEDSLRQLLDAAGFESHETLPPPMPRLFRGWRPWVPWRGFAVQERLRRRLNSLLHRIVFALRGQRGQSCYEMNVTVRSRRSPGEARS